jgi:hypothetical protein
MQFRRCKRDGLLSYGSLGVPIHHEHMFLVGADGPPPSQRFAAKPKRFLRQRGYLC